MKKCALPTLYILIGWALFTGLGSKIISPATGATDTGALSAYLLGPAKSLLSQKLYDRADLYFHKGVTGKKKVAFQSFYQKWEEAINPVKHAHTHGNETLEIMPWLRLATKADPKNVEPYLVAAYWLNTEGDRCDLALNVLEEAAQNNPTSHEVYLEKGRTLLRLERLDDATVAINRAIELVIASDAELEDKKIEWSHLLTLRSLLSEASGNRDESIAAVRQNLELYPNRNGLKERLAELTDHPLDPEHAREKIAQFFKPAHQCEEGHEHDEHCGCDEHTEPEHVHDEHCNH